MKKRMTIMVIALVVVFGGLVGFNLFKKYMIAKYFEHFKMPPVSISTTTAVKTRWQPTLKAVGNFTAANGVDVNSQQAGNITKINFKSGEYVNEGQLLIELDDSIDQANLEKAQATLQLAKLDYQRQKALYGKAATSTSAVDTAKANLEQAKAAAAQIKAVIDQKHIRAPFAGKLGVRLVNLGQYVSPGTTKLVTLQSQNPLFLQFYLPEQYLKQLYVGQPIVFQVEGYPTAFKAKIQAINSKIDSATHNVLVQAIVNNCTQHALKKRSTHAEEHALGMPVQVCKTTPMKPDDLFIFMPGMFATLHVLLPAQKDVIVLPRSAISYSLYGNSVYVVRSVKDEKTSQTSLKAYQQFVKTGDERGTQVVILKGVKEGDQVVNAGQLKLSNGADVVVNNQVKLDAVQDVVSLGQ